MKLHKQFKLPESCDAETVVVRETDGRDEQRAALQVEARPGRTTLFNELVRLSITEVDGKPVLQPFADWDSFSSRTRGFVIRAFESMNDLDDSEVAVFLQGAEVTDATPTVAPVEPPVPVASSG